MPKFIECQDVETGNPVAINIDTIARVYQKEPGVVSMVMTTIEEYEYVDTDDPNGGITMVTSISERVKCKGDYVEVMQKIMAAQLDIATGSK